jgi:FtsH-binding integral membrane protein
MVGPIVMFLVGLVSSVFWSRAVQAVSRREPLAAGLWVTVLDAITIGSTWYVVEVKSIPSLLVYAIGGGLGTAIGLVRRR